MQCTVANFVIEGNSIQRVAAQCEQTDALLNKYINILGKSEAVARLIFDERWEGADADEEQMEHELREAAEAKRRAEEARALAERRERERLEKEERVRQEKLEKEAREAERKTKTSTRGVRGVRGTRASMRGAARGTAARGGA